PGLSVVTKVTILSACAFVEDAACADDIRGVKVVDSKGPVTADRAILDDEQPSILDPAATTTVTFIAYDDLIAADRAVYDRHRTIGFDDNAGPGAMVTEIVADRASVEKHRAARLAPNAPG